jgi:prephenate dehydrogenase
VRAHVVGLGLIGSSIALGLSEKGHVVSGEDSDPARARRALEVGAVSSLGGSEDAELAFVATPAASVVPVARRLLESGPDAPVVSDVAGVKRQIASELTAPFFVPGHPMAGSEQEGPDGATGELFLGASWVLTPTKETSEVAFSLVRQAVSDLGAEVVVLSPELHDDLVAVISHVPHLTAATLMAMAASTEVDQESLMRLAAGGFRDMTRIAAGTPGIWPDICADNKEAILAGLDALARELSEIRRIVAEEDRPALTERLEAARSARQNLPARGARPAEVRELRVLVPDRPGVLAEVTSIAGGLGANIYDIEIAHSSEGARGVVVLALSPEAAELLAGKLRDVGFQVGT